MQIIKIVLIGLTAHIAGITFGLVVTTTIKVQQYKACVAKSEKTDDAICECAHLNKLPKYCNDILGN